MKNASPHSYSFLNHNKETKLSLSEIASVLLKNSRFSLIFFLNYLKEVLGIIYFLLLSPQRICYLNIITLSFYPEDGIEPKSVNASMPEISRADSVNGHRPTLTQPAISSLVDLINW